LIGPSHNLLRASLDAVKGRFSLRASYQSEKEASSVTFVRRFRDAHSKDRKRLQSPWPSQKLPGGVNMTYTAKGTFAPWALYLK
jgi:hypothetical protein